MEGRIARENVQLIKLPIIGKIKIGMKVKSKEGKDIPKSLDYFIADGKYKSYFDKSYPEKPNKIQIIFVSDDLKEICNERYELRTKAGDLFGDGDGKEFRIWDVGKKQYNEYSLSEHPDLLVRSAKAAESIKGWEVILTLRFIIPAIKGVLGQWQLSTKGGKSSINAIRDTFDFVHLKAGSITRIAFDLTVQKFKSQKPNDPSTYPVINLIPNVSDENLALVQGFIESNKSLPMITDEIIEKQKQLEAGSTIGEPVKMKDKDYPAFLRESVE